MKILDCSLRDGGYYCNWDFDDRMVERYLDAIAAAGIPYVEIGFRSLPGLSGFSGKYRFCRETFLQRLFKGRSLRVAVMIDGKDFLRGPGPFDLEGLQRLFGPRAESTVELVRITATQGGLEKILPIVTLLKEKGYRVSINLMQISMLSLEELKRVSELLERSPVDVFYLADSFGGLTPEETGRIFETIRGPFSRLLGFHGHDNLGLALANSLAARDAGATMIDCSMLGMGRGAGNLRTEQLLLYLNAKEGHADLNPTPLFDVVLNDFGRLHEHYQWGTNLPYMLSGVYNVHPIYAQQLLQVRRYSPLEVVSVLENLKQSGGGASFNRENLSRALRERFTRIEDRMPVTELSGYEPRSPQFGGDRPLLLLGSGPSIRERSADINEFIRAQSPIVLECNFQKEIDGGDTHFSLFSNYQRLETQLAALAGKRRRIVLGMSQIGRRLATLLNGHEIYHYPYRVQEGRFEAELQECVIPHDVVAMFACAFALRGGAREIFVCGFDGYVDGPGSHDQGEWRERVAMEREMEGFFRLFREKTAGQLKLVSLTPTVFDLQQDSLYAYLE